MKEEIKKRRKNWEVKSNKWIVNKMEISMVKEIVINKIKLKRKISMVEKRMVKEWIIVRSKKVI